MPWALAQKDIEELLDLGAGSEEERLTSLRDLRRLILTQYPLVSWPIEYRTLRADDIFLSPSFGRDSVTISVHEAPDALVVANVWDGGSARMMASLGFAALATSSGASAGLLGRRDGRVTRDEALAQARLAAVDAMLIIFPRFR